MTHRSHLRLADDQDRTLAQLTEGQEVELTMRGTLIETYTAAGAYSHVVEVPGYGRVIITPLNGHSIRPTNKEQP